MEGWLRKKSHHIGQWKYRYFKFDGQILRYWTTEHKASSGKDCRGEISIVDRQVVAYEELRLAIIQHDGSYDEELLAKTAELRDEWVQCLNAAVSRHRMSVSEHTDHDAVTKFFLHGKRIWEPLEEAVVAELGKLPSVSDVLDNPSPPPPEAGSYCNGHNSALNEIVLAHVRHRSVLLRLSEQALRPRQGKFVKFGRRVFRKQAKAPAGGGVAEAMEERWVLLLSSRSLIRKSPVASRRFITYLPLSQSLPVELETLHAYADSEPKTRPLASMPMLHCEVSSIERSDDGSFWELCIKDGTSDESEPPRKWTLVLPTKEEAEAWLYAIEVAQKAASARNAGLKRTVEETLQDFDIDPAAWKKSMMACLADTRDKRQVASSQKRPASPGAYSGGSSSSKGVRSQKENMLPNRQATAVDTIAASTAFDRVLNACSEVWNEAAEILEAAMQNEPRVREDVCEAVLDAAIDPAIACIGQCWRQWGTSCSAADARRTLHWLWERHRLLCRAGVLFPALDVIIAGLSVELSLRMGNRLRTMVRNLLAQELRGWNPNDNVSATASRSSPGAGTAPLQGATLSKAVSNLPVDFFTFVFACLSIDLKQPVLPLRLSSQRITKFIVFELQEVILGWLFETQPEVSNECRERPLVKAESGVENLPPRSQRWLVTVAGLANRMQVFVGQCGDVSDLHLWTDLQEQHSNESTDLGAGAWSSDDGLLKDALPFEWSLASEKIRFNAISDALMWAMCDIATATWRLKVLTADPVQANVQGGKQPEGSSNMSGFLQSHLERYLQILREILEPEIFEVLLKKVFGICLCCYLIRLSRGLWFKTNRVRRTIGVGSGQTQEKTREKEEQEFALSEEAANLCTYFGKIFEDTSGKSQRSAGLWQSSKALDYLKTVWLAPSDAQGWKFEGPKEEVDMLKNLLQVVSKTPLPLKEVLMLFNSKVLENYSSFDEIPDTIPDILNDFPDARNSEGKFYETLNPEVRNEALYSLDTRRRCLAGIAAGAPPPSNFRSESFSAPSSASISRQSLPCAATVQCSTRPNLRIPSVRIAAEGQVCDLRVEQTGSYGMFCNILRFEGPGKDDLPLLPIAGASPSLYQSQVVPTFATMSSLSIGSAHSMSNCSLYQLCITGQATGYRCWRRRWIQFHRSGQEAKFEVCAGRSGPGGARPQCLESLPLTGLLEAEERSSTRLDLTFEHEPGRNGEVIRYTLHFDCPSHLFRARLVLGGWGKPVIPEPRPVIALTVQGLAKQKGESAAGSWDGLPGPLVRLQLQTRLGGLWRDVKADLSKPSQTMSKPSQTVSR